jgi:hypothetical protein
MRATRGPYLAPILIEWTVIWVLAACSDGRAAQEETLSGPDSHETLYVRLSIYWETGPESGHICSNEALDSICNTLAILSRTS